MQSQNITQTPMLSNLDFLHPSPKAPTLKQQAELKAKGQRENIVALEIQFLVHNLLNDDTVILTPETRAELVKYQGLAFAGYHPSVGELQLFGGSSDSEQIAQDFSVRILDLIDERRQHWGNTNYNLDEQIMHQDIDAVAELAVRLDGEERIVVFGSARLPEDHPAYEGTRWLTKTLVGCQAHEDGTTEQVITGGGPSIMKAANLGALEGALQQYQKLLRALKEGKEDPQIIMKKISAFRKQMHSIGVGIIVPHEQSWNDHLQANLTIKSFSPRKVGLVSVVAGRSIKHESGEKPKGNGKRKPAVFGMPGGFGTLDELWEVATLIQCKKMPRVPIFVVGRMSKIVQISTSILNSLGTIKVQDLDIFIHCVDEIDALEKYLEYYNISPNQEIAAAIDERKRKRGVLVNAELSFRRLRQKMSIPYFLKRREEKAA